MKKKQSNKKGGAQKFIKHKPHRKQTEQTGIAQVLKYLRKWPLLLPGVLTILYYIIFQFSAKIDDSVFLGGDTWEYHAMGVNMAKGHGVNKFGAFEPYETYKFTWGDQNMVDRFNRTKRNNFLRTPGYPFFLGIVYSLFGVHVAVAKMIQLWMIAMIAGFMPILGLHLADQKGYLAGIIAGPFIMISSYQMSELIMTEAITAFALFFICLAMAKTFKKPNLKTGCLMGLVTALGLLIKGSLIFIPMILVAFFIIQGIRHKSSNYFKALGAMAITMSAMVFLWSQYASSKRMKPVLLSTQSETLLLDCNNRLTTDGSWHPEWRKDKQNPQQYYHNDPSRENLSSLGKVMHFYKDYPQNIIVSLKNKLIRGFSPFSFLWLFAFCLVIQLIKQLFKKREEVNNIVTAIGIIGFIVCAILLFQNHLHRFTPDGNISGVNVVPGWISIAGIILMSIAALISTFRKEHRVLDVPTVLFIVVANFVLLILLFWGSVRFIKVTDFLFVFMAFLLPVSWIVDYLKTTKKISPLFD